MATKDQDPKAAAAVADKKGTESRNYDATEHKMSLEELKAKFETAIDLQNPKESKGLSEQEAKNRLLRDGPNAMTPPKQTPEIVKFLMQFTNMFMILLMVASALSFLAYGLDKTEAVNLYCGSALVIIVFLQCLASYLEERKSHAVMNSLKSMMPSQCSVVRDGLPRRIPASELVIGDIVLLKEAQVFFGTSEPSGGAITSSVIALATAMATKDQDHKDLGAAADKKGKESRNYDATEHKMSLEELKEKFETAIDEQNPKESKGLSDQEAKNRLLRDGPNAMTPPKQTPEIVKFLMQFTNMFMILLMVASALSFLAYGLDKTEAVNLYCGSALVIIVFLQCLASYLEERKSHAVMNSLKSMMPSQCSVVRDGLPRRIPASELVIGDIVLLKGGDRVPADLRLIQTSGLKVESSSLTGEPDAFEMSVAHTHEEPFESKNLAFNTSQCTEGAAVGVVIRTSDRTLIGMVAKLATATKVQVSTLQKEVTRIVKFVTMLAIFLALCILIIGFSQGVRWQLVVNLVITVFCANVPQGLPA
eukprot:CAMPEP_0203976200 /NCGR_PEP_ID=MMETSP0359-20131031/100994_1 /ASSEMBLY_ACC=CAM_ASM_000338 /TAXON_ID=268821 /ORGANISM="Scrippsiella Hangoei, Strain SHTV-5" /LENGTH=534 /DNA_ID=CAMNT_0050914403 /DNA_START=60 /DNA_END=1662 /DNA_ORIENTATION=+